MPLAGRAMLLTSMDVDAADEAEFNRRYDREHLEERVAIEGFLEVRRYIAEQRDNTGFKSAEISTGVYRLLWDLAKMDLAKI